MIIGANPDPSHAGLSESDIAELRALAGDSAELPKPTAATTVKVFWEAKDVIRLFDACYPTQWRVSGGMRTGIDYAAMDVCRQWLGIEPTEILLKMLRLCEIVALNYWAEKAAK